MKSNFEVYPAPRRAVRLAKRTRVGIDLRYNDVAKVGEITGTEFGFGEMQMQRREGIFSVLAPYPSPLSTAQTTWADYYPCLL